MPYTPSTRGWSRSRGREHFIDTCSSTTSSVGLNRLGRFHRDRAIFAHLVHRVGNDVANGLVAVRGNRRDPHDLLAVRMTFLLILLRCSTTTAATALVIPRCNAIGLPLRGHIVASLHGKWTRPKRSRWSAIAGRCRWSCWQLGAPSGRHVLVRDLPVQFPSPPSRCPW